jgi:ABC-type multidrug transport system fused ATPase/permease subunit
MKYAWWLWRHTRGIRLNSALRIVVGITQVVLGLMMVWLSKRFIDETIRTGTDADIVQMIILLVSVVFAGILLRQLFFYLTVTAGIRQTNTLRLQVFSQMFSRQLYDDHEMHSGDITSRLTKDIDTVSNATTSVLPQMIITTLQLIGAFLLMRWFDEWLAWALLLLTPVALVFGKLIAHKLRQMTLDIRNDESRIQMQVQEGMEHNAILRSLGSEQWVTGRLDNMQQRLKGNVMRRTRFTVLTRIILGSAFGLGYMMAFVWGGLGLRNGTITFGVMTSFLQLVGMIQNPILSLLNMIPGLIHATASIDRLQELDDNGNENGNENGNGNRNENGNDNGKHSKFTGPLGARFDDITFRYATGEREVLSHFTHDFQPGSKTALMGPTGIGKTTLFRLLLSFIVPKEGRVLLYDAHSEEPVSDATRIHFVFVPQGNTLMSGTIRYNLQLACPKATDDQLLDALHTACADFVLDLPDGLDTELGERGSGLSEGQAQRIAIARGLLRPGSILLLDEISASLDEQTERELFTRLFAARPDKTMLFITHRPAVAELCTSIVRL